MKFLDEIHRQERNEHRVAEGHQHGRRRQNNERDLPGLRLGLGRNFEGRQRRVVCGLLVARSPLCRFCGRTLALGVGRTVAFFLKLREIELVIVVLGLLGRSLGLRLGGRLSRRSSGPNLHLGRCARAHLKRIVFASARTDLLRRGSGVARFFVVFFRHFAPAQHSHNRCGVRSCRRREIRSERPVVASVSCSAVRKNGGTDAKKGSETRVNGVEETFRQRVRLLLLVDEKTNGRRSACAKRTRKHFKKVFSRRADLPFK